MPRVRFRIHFGPNCTIGPGKVELLEAIAETGSIRQAARRMGMSYRRAWVLVDSINRSFDERATTASTGGLGGGGGALTPFGEEIVRRYRAAAKRIDKAVEAQFAPIQRKVASSATPAPRRISNKK